MNLEKLARLAVFSLLGAVAVSSSQRSFLLRRERSTTSAMSSTPLLGRAHGFVAFVPSSHAPIHQGHNRFMNMTKKVAVSKPSALFEAALSAENSDAPTQEWDVDRYQNQHSFVWEYGSSLVDLVDLNNDEVRRRGRQPNGVPQRILDVGCGSGQLTHELFLRANNDDGSNTVIVQGMDADPSMVDAASTQFPHLDFFQGDVRNFRLDNDDGVDVIFSNAALHWVPPVDAERAVQSMAQALRPGGQFVAEFGGKGNVEKIVRTTLRHVGEYRSRPEGVSADVVESPWYFPSISEFTSLLEKHGIHVTSALLYDRPTLLEEGDAGLSNWLQMFGSKFFEGLTESQQAEILQQINLDLLPELWDGESWTADYRRIRVIGKKHEQ